MFEVRKRIQAIISKAFKREKGRWVCDVNSVFFDNKRKEGKGKNWQWINDASYVLGDMFVHVVYLKTFLGLNTY